MVIEFECRRCGLVVSHKEFEANKFCPNCGTFLQRHSTWNSSGNGEQQNKKQICSDGLGINSLMINPENGKEIALILFEKFNFGDGIFGHNMMPEDFLPCWGSDLTDLEIDRGSYEQLLFITLVVSIDYQRDADQLWEAGRITFEDPETRWLFYPVELAKRSLVEIIYAMKKHSLSKKPNKDAGIWSKVSKSLLDFYGSNPVNLIEKCDFDALNLYQQKFDPKFKKNFPYFSGDKIFPLWIRMLHDNLDFKLKNLSEIPIPVDVHIARATLSTNCLTGQYFGSISTIAPIIDEVWTKTMNLITNNGLKYRLQLDEPLWHLSRYGCRYRKDNYCPKKGKCPVAKFCSNGFVSVSTKGIKVNTIQ